MGQNGAARGNDAAPGGVGVAEQRVERALQGVGQDERAGDERDAQDDRQRGQRQPELVG